MEKHVLPYLSVYHLDNVEEEGGYLEAIRRCRPYAVVLFDQIEKRTRMRVQHHAAKFR